MSESQEIIQAVQDVIFETCKETKAPFDFAEGQKDMAVKILTTMANVVALQQENILLQLAGMQE